MKYRNMESSTRNYYIQSREGFITTEYHKARASTNYSFYIVRFLPESVATLIALYVIYIHPFAKMLFHKSFVLMNLPKNVGLVWNCLKFCKRNPSND